MDPPPQKRPRMQPAGEPLLATPPPRPPQAPQAHAQSPRLPTNPQLYARAVPDFSKPKELGVFSVDESRSFRNDDSALRFYSAPTIGVDLTDGFADRYIQKNEDKLEYIDFVLQWVMAQPERKADLLRPGRFVSWRGLLTRIMCLPYENRSGLCVSATRINGVTYLCEWDTADKQRDAHSRASALNCYMGYRFEGYCTVEREGKAKGLHVVNTNVGLCTVNASTLARKHALLFAGEVDCQRPDTHEYIELKTCITPSCERQETSLLKHKLMKWWAQSYLVGVPEVVCGFRSDEGLLQQVKVYKTLEIPRIVRTQGLWDPAVLMNFLDSYLSFVHASIAADEETYIFNTISIGSQGRVVSVSKDSDGRKHFLPKWYTSFLGVSEKSARVDDT